MKNAAKLALLAVAVFLVGVSYRAIRKPRIDFRRAERMYARGDCAAAVPIYQRLAAAGFSKRAEAIGRICQCHLLAGDEAAAMNLIEKIDPESSEAFQIQRQLGDVFAEFGYFSQARGLYEQVLKVDPDHCETRFHRACILSAQGEFDEAEKEYRGLLGRCACLAVGSEPPAFGVKCATNEFPECNIRWELGKILAYRGKFPQARSEYMKSLSQRPKRAEVRWELARVIFWGGDPVESLRVIETAADPDLSPEEAAMKADLMMVVKDYAGTEAAYNRILKADPDNFGTRLKLARLFSWGRKFEDSARQYRLLLGAQPRNGKVRRELAGVLFCLRKYPEATRQLALSLKARATP